jgi:hypothetical protein
MTLGGCPADGIASQSLRMISKSSAVCLQANYSKSSKLQSRATTLTALDRIKPTVDLLLIKSSQL